MYLMTPGMSLMGREVPQIVHWVNVPIQPLSDICIAS